jgi:hypothetical protein
MGAMPRFVITRKRLTPELSRSPSGCWLNPAVTQHGLGMTYLPPDYLLKLILLAGTACCPRGG